VTHLHPVTLATRVHDRACRLPRKVCGAREPTVGGRESRATVALTALSEASRTIAHTTVLGKIGARCHRLTGIGVTSRGIFLLPSLPSVASLPSPSVVLDILVVRGRRYRIRRTSEGRRTEGGGRRAEGGRKRRATFSQPGAKAGVNAHGYEGNTGDLERTRVFGGKMPSCHHPITGIRVTSQESRHSAVICRHLPSFRCQSVVARHFGCPGRPISRFLSRTADMPCTRSGAPMRRSSMVSHVGFRPAGPRQGPFRRAWSSVRCSSSGPQ